MFFFLLITSEQGYTQLIYQPYSYQFYQKLNTVIYSPLNGLHTSIKPYFISDSSEMRAAYDLLVESQKDSVGRNKYVKKIFNEHLIDIKNKDYTFYVDFLPDFQIGKELNEKKTTSLNSRGYQMAGTIGTKFFFYTSGYENQGKFAKYESDYIFKVGMVPGQAYDRVTVTNSFDWAYVTSIIGYAVNKNLTIALGEDKTFIGDGYRSVLLSDFAAPYPILRINYNLGKQVSYTAMWAYMEDQNATQFNSFYNYRRKWGAFHYVDWTITKRASLGFFNALIAEEANDNGQAHGFDVNYINPIFFSSSLRPKGTTPDHTLFGFNAKYKLWKKTVVYGQLLMDQSASPNNNNGRTALQLGFRGADLLKVKKLNYLFEFNRADPYTYSNQYPIVNYTELSEPLAHPYGANFKEYLGILNYSIGNLDFQAQVVYSKYGLDIGNINYGKDITISNNANIPSGTPTIGQGLATTLMFAEGTMAYILNKKYNLRLEFGALYREEKNSQFNHKTMLFSFGLRSSFRNLYHDF